MELEYRIGFRAHHAEKGVGSGAIKVHLRLAKVAVHLATRQQLKHLQPQSEIINHA